MQQVNQPTMRKPAQKQRGCKPSGFTVEQKTYFNDTAFPELWALKNKALERMELVALPLAANG